MDDDSFADGQALEDLDFQAVTEVSERETWVTVAEWMQTGGPNVVIHPDNKYGADNSVYVACILWDQPNASWNQH